MVYIYGTVHLLQTSVPLCFPNMQMKGLLQGKLHFAADVASILAQYPEMSVVAEEAVACFPSIAQECALLGMRLYTSIDMPMAERSRRSIPALQMTKDGTTQLNIKVIEMVQAQNEYMFRRLLEYLSDGVDALVVCGALHVPGLKKLVEARGIEAKTDYITERPWCKDEHIGQTISSLREQIAFFSSHI